MSTKECTFSFLDVVVHENHLYCLSLLHATANLIILTTVQLNDIEKDKTILKLETIQVLSCSRQHIANNVTGNIPVKNPFLAVK